MRKLLLALALLFWAGPALAAATLAPPPFAGERIRFGVLPALDALPLQAAVQEGIFRKQGLEVELVPFVSAMERDTAMQTGRIDGYFGDLVATVLLIQNNVPVKVAATACRTMPDRPMFGLVAAPGAKIADASDLKNARTGISVGTVAEYLLDRISAQNAIPAGAFERVNVPKIPIRVQMLLQNQLDLALLPEPLLALARAKGATLVMSDSTLNIPLTVLCLNDRHFDGAGEAARAFVTAVARAVQRLNKEPETFRALMAETCGVPRELAATFPMLTYPAPALPDEAEVDRVQTWLQGKGLLKAKLPYHRVVTDQMR